MTKGKKAIFLIIAAAGLVSIIMSVYPILMSFFNGGATFVDEASNITIGPDKYIIGKDIDPGVYDVDVLEGRLTFMQRQLSKQDKVLGLRLNKGEHVDVNGKGKIKLSPAGFKQVSMGEDGKYDFPHSGFYQVGKQIPEGEYVIFFTDTGQEKNKDNEKPFVQVLSPKGKILQSYNLKGSGTTTVALKKGQTLEIEKFLFHESTNMIVSLKKK
ncbi:hypothetical protein [Falsibacillus albus]|uniref:Uncharacterized protein n=1 Tax=Falsibacillus albus TaxID=2478915 RepID=A0A3L7JVK2_9BACI|nr:hypothetical protein [Falsibacillus albus]RLQ94887.1 hypothetical protein D9X91_12965 [Falsibacillus albus]